LEKKKANGALGNKNHQKTSSKQKKKTGEDRPGRFFHWQKKSREERGRVEFAKRGVETRSGKEQRKRNVEGDLQLHS